MKILKITTASLMTVAGLVGLIFFDQIFRTAGIISPDGDISAFMLVRFRIVLVSLLPLGLTLFFKNRLLKSMSQLLAYIDSIPSGRYILRLLAIAFIVRAVIVLFYPFNLWIDYSAYDQLGWNIVKQGCYCIDGIATAYRPPGYPLILAGIYHLFGHLPHLAAAFNIIPSLIIILLTFFIGNHLFGARIAKLSALIMALFPSQILYCNLLASEVFFTAILYLALYLILKKTGAREIAIAGVFIGLAALIRPIALVVPASVVGYLILNRYKPRVIVVLMIILLAAVTVTVFPWMSRNYIKKGKLTISTITGINLLAGNSPGAGFGWNPDAVKGLPIGDPESELYVDSIGQARATEYIASDPVGFIKRGIMKTAYLFAVDLEGVDYQLKNMADRGETDRYFLLGIAVQWYYYLALLCGLAGFVLLIRKGKILASSLLWLTILIWIAVHFLFYAEGRYHFPLIPIIAIFGAYYVASKRSQDE